MRKNKRYIKLTSQVLLENNSFYLGVHGRLGTRPRSFQATSSLQPYDAHQGGHDLACGRPQLPVILRRTDNSLGHSGSVDRNAHWSYQEAACLWFWHDKLLPSMDGVCRTPELTERFACGDIYLSKSICSPVLASGQYEFRKLGNRDRLPTFRQDVSCGSEPYKLLNRTSGESANFEAIQSRIGYRFSCQK
jgi:hypothetical protein